MSLRSSIGALSALAACFVSGSALAGGYDTPMLYSARHLGMGGTAIGYVHDPSALFHNPAGLVDAGRVAALVDFSLLLGKLSASPSLNARDVESELTVAPFFMVAGAYRLTPWLSAGLGLYPIASSGATYRYGNPGFENKTSLMFVEATPALAARIGKQFSVGLGYRVTLVRLERFEGNRDDGTVPFLDFKLRGFNFAGFRLGLKWTPTPRLSAGLVYRQKTTTRVENDAGIALGKTFHDVSTEFVLPTKFGAGVRYDLDDHGPHLGLALDVEYSLNSENHGSPLRGTLAGASSETAVPNVFGWKDSVTLRLGAEYRTLHDAELARDRLALRVGYVFDSRTANPQYPTAFGTPPGATQVFTCGAGYDFGWFQSNLALAYRFGSASVSAQDLSADGREECAFCGAAGDYAIKLTGLYVDASYAF
ncbi:MAG: outer membrane protein transport protein [Polyangiaceae bacterium]